MLPAPVATGYDRSATRGAQVSRHAIGHGDRGRSLPANQDAVSGDSQVQAQRGAGRSSGRRPEPLRAAARFQPPARPAGRRGRPSVSRPADAVQSLLPVSTASAKPPMDWLTRVRQPDIRLFAGRWTAIFGGSLALFLIRFLLPSPVGMADNGDGPRMMCGLGVAPLTGGYPRYDAFAYFAFAPNPVCATADSYASSQHMLLVAARDLTPLVGLSGYVNLIALGIVTCLLQAAGIASLACGLRLRPRNTVLVAAAVWLIMADAAFFDTYASPFSEGATLTGLLLVTAGVLYLRRGPLGLAFGLVLCGAGSYLAVFSKEQYVVLAVPICITIVAASASGARRGLAGLLTARAGAAGLVAGLLAVGAVAYVHQDTASPLGSLLHQEQAVDVIFTDIVTGHDNAVADLHALGLPASWARYAGGNFWSPHSAYHDPLYARYLPRLTDVNLTWFLLTHPADAISIGQQAANDALQLRVNYLGSYAPATGHPAGALENRVSVLSSIMQAIPAGLGLLWLLPLWAAMATLAAWALRTSRAAGWHHDCALAILMLTGCAFTAFIAAAYFDGVEVTRHMLGSNLAMALAFALSAILLSSMVRRGVAAGDHESDGATSRQADPCVSPTAPPLEATGPAWHGTPA